MAIRVELELIDGTFTTRMLHAGETIDQFNAAIARTHPQVARLAQQTGGLTFRAFNQADGAAKGLVATLRDFSIILGAATLAVAKLQQTLGGVVGQVVQVNAHFERMTRLLAGMSTAADPMADARNEMAQYQQLAKEIPLAQEAIIAGMVKLKAVGMGSTNTLRSVADAVSAFGGGEEAFNRTLLAITQMSGKGVIQMEELRQQLGEAVPRATELMARSMGVSYATLLKQISQGNVEAKRSLQLLLLEFNRTFGGASLRQMSTYEGQIQVLKTNFQLLAQAIGGDFNNPDSFFGTLKQQLADLNFYLSGPQAKQFAQSIGEGMKQAVIFIRQVIDTAVAWKNELLDLIKVMAVAFGAQLIGRFAVSVIAAFGQMRVAVQAFSGQWAIFMNEWRRASVAGNLVSGLMGGWQGALAGFGMRLGSLSAMLPALALGFTNLITLLPAAGMALWAVAEYFDLFGSAAKRAWEELKNLNVTSTETIKSKYAPLLEANKKELARLEKENGRIVTVGMGMGKIDNTAQIAELKKQIAEQQKLMGQAVTDAAAEDARKIASDTAQMIADRLGVMQIGYDQQMIETNKHYDEVSQRELAAGRSSITIETERQKKLREIQLASDKQKINWLTDQIKLQQRIVLNSLDPQALIVAGQRLQVYQEQLLQVQNTYAATMNLPTGIPTVAAVDDTEAKMKKAETALNDIKERASGLRIQLQGGSTAMGELLQRIANGDFGDLQNLSVQKLVDSLITAQTEVDNLRDAIDYITESQKLYDDTLTGIQDKTFAYQTEGMSELDKYIAKQQKLAQGVSPGGRMALMMLDLRNKTEDANASLSTLITGFTDRLFGTDTANKGNTVVGILDQMLQRVQGISTAIGGIQMGAGGGGMSFTGPTMSGPSIEQAVKNGILSLIGAAEGTDKGRGYNETLGYGAFTGGPVDLVNMTLREILSLQQKMLDNPANSYNSSAVGRYQITSETLKDFMGRMGLSPDMKFTPQLQDAIARAIIEATGTSADALRGRWAGLGRVSDGQIATAVDNGAMGSTGLPSGIRDSNNQIIEAKRQIEELTRALLEQGDAAVAAEIRKYGNELEDVTAKTNGLKDAEVELRRRIKDGQLNNLKTNPDDPYYAKTFETLRKLITAEEQYQKVKEARKDVDSAIEKTQKTLLEAERELKQAQNEGNRNPYAEQNAAMQKLIDQYDILIEKAKIAYGIDSAQYTAIVAEKEKITALYQQRDLQATMNFLKEKQKAYAQENISEAQRAKIQVDEQIAEIQRYVTNFKGSEAERVQVVAQAEAAIAELRKKSLAVSGGAFQQQMQQWQDLGANLSQVMANAASSLADGITSMIMGEEVSWQDLLQNSLKQLVNTGIQYMMSSMMGGKSQLAGVAGSKAGATAKSGGKGATSAPMLKTLKAMFPIAHTGGIVGRLSSGRMVNPMVFAGAPRFHSGGMIQGLGIQPGEVPIIARKGEGVFTPEQMRAMATGSNHQSTAINTNVTVNATGGEQKQNEDLAKQVAKQVENSVRGIVYKELRAQSRPGNMMGR